MASDGGGGGGEEGLGELTVQVSIYILTLQSKLLLMHHIVCMYMYMYE